MTFDQGQGHQNSKG